MEKPILAAMLSCAGTSLTDDEKRLFEKTNPLGISLFVRNIQNTKQLKDLVKNIKEVIGRQNVIIAIDEEGGRVSRLKSITKHLYVSEEVLSQTDVMYSKMHAKLIAHDLKQYGINTNYAPLVDRKASAKNKVLMNRCFSGSTQKIIQYGKALADSYIAEGICPCIKHVPGHFATSADPHLNCISTDISLEEIEKKVKYLQSFADYPCVMTSHIILKAIDDKMPVTMSSKCINNLLRGYLGFKGLLISDAIDMHALRGTISERAENSWKAGTEVVCYCSGKYEDLYNICQHKCFMSEKSLIRFANIEKIIHNTNQSKDILYTRKLYQTEFKGKLQVDYMYDATEVLHQMLNKGEDV